MKEEFIRPAESAPTTGIIHAKLINRKLKSGKAAESIVNPLHQSLMIESILASGKPVHVILADDDEDDRMIFEEAIRDIHPKIVFTSAENGEALMQMLNASDHALPDLVFIDLNMPVKSGQDCLQEIRSNQKLKNLPVIIYSTSASPRDIDETFEKGANLYMRKPNSYKELTALTKKLFSLDLHDYAPNSSKLKFVLSTI